MKDKKWLKEEIESKFHRWYDSDQTLNSLIANINNLINQLDEPESVETEVKSKQELIEKWESAIESAEFYGKGKEERLISYMKDFVSDLSQLDDPEVLSQELPVLPKFVADWMEENSTGRYSWWKKIAEWESEVPDKDRKVYDWYTQSNEDTFIIAWITRRYEIEEEQLYYVLDKNELPLLIKLVSNSYVRRANTYYTIKETNDSKFYQLTEQEIKDYDERFWAFAVPVEEL